MTYQICKLLCNRVYRTLKNGEIDNKNYNRKKVINYQFRDCQKDNSTGALGSTT